MADVADQQVVTRASKKGIWGWMLFDWAAQPFHTLIVTFIFAPYFASRVVSDPVIGQTKWAWAAAIAGVIIAILSPILGALADVTGPRKPWVFGFSIMSAFGAGALWYVTPAASESIVFWGLGAFVIGLVGIEFAAVFNNAMMPDLVPREELGRLSGNAWALGYIGGLFCLIAMLALMIEQGDSEKTLIGLAPLLGLDAALGEDARVAGIIASVWLMIFVLPLMMFTPDTSRVEKVTGAVMESLRGLLQTLKNLPNNPSLFAYLGSSLLYRDGLNGLYTFGAIYAGTVMGWSITSIGIFGIIGAAAGALGAWIGGILDDKTGPKPVVVWSLFILIATSIVVITTDPHHILLMAIGSPEAPSQLPDIIFYVCGGFIGAAGGSVQAASRTLLVDQAEPDRMTEAFGLYALSGKATAFIAPLLVGIFTQLFDSQQIGIIPVILLFVLGLLLLPMVKKRAAV